MTKLLMKILFAIYFILTALTVITTYIVLTDLYDDLNTDKQTTISLVTNEITHAYNNALDSVKQTVISNIALINIYGVNITDKQFGDINQIELSPFRDSFENIRYSPLIYREDFDKHIAFARENYSPDYRLHLESSLNPDPPNITLTDQPFVIPVMASDPPFFLKSALGFDLFTFITGTNFFNRFTALSGNLLLSGPIEFFNSPRPNSKGLYIGALINNTDCCYYDAGLGHFIDLAELNKDTRCILGFSYTAFIAEVFFQGAIDLLRSTPNSYIINTIEFIVVNNRKHTIYTIPDIIADEFDPIGDNTQLINKNYETFTVNTVNSFPDMTVYILFTNNIVNEDILNDIRSVWIGAVVCYFVLLVIITVIWYYNQRAHKDNQRVLKAEHERIEALQFIVRYVNHELRNPLSFVYGYVQIACKRLEQYFAGLSKSEQTLLKDIYNDLVNAREINGTVLNVLNDILDLEKLKQGKVKLNTETVKLHDIISALTKSLQFKIDEKSLVIKFSQVFETPNYEILIDRNRLSQILINYMTNAYKNTDQGYIKIIVTEDSDNIIIIVSDTGHGISPETQQKIFTEQFMNRNPKAQQSIDNTGMGLYICAKLAELMGFKLNFDSKVDQGSNFRVYMPKNIVIKTKTTHITQNIEIV